MSHSCKRNLSVAGQKLQIFGRAQATAVVIASLSVVISRFFLSRLSLYLFQ